MNVQERYRVFYQRGNSKQHFLLSLYIVRITPFLHEKVLLDLHAFLMDIKK